MDYRSIRYNFISNTVRTIVHADGNQWFSVNDIRRLLGLKYRMSVKDMQRIIDGCAYDISVTVFNYHSFQPGGVKLIEIASDNGIRNIRCVDVAGLLSLIASSRAPLAAKLRETAWEAVEKHKRSLLSDHHFLESADKKTVKEGYVRIVMSDLINLLAKEYLKVERKVGEFEKKKRTRQRSPKKKPVQIDKDNRDYDGITVTPEAFAYAPDCVRCVNINGKVWWCCIDVARLLGFDAHSSTNYVYRLIGSAEENGITGQHIFLRIRTKIRVQPTRFMSTPLLQYVLKTARVDSAVALRESVENMAENIAEEMTFNNRVSKYLPAIHSCNRLSNAIYYTDKDTLTRLMAENVAKDIYIPTKQEIEMQTYFIRQLKSAVDDDGTNEDYI